MVAGEPFKMMAGVDLVQVPYRGEPVAMPNAEDRCRLRKRGTIRAGIAASLPE